MVNYSAISMCECTYLLGPGPDEWASTYPLCNGSNQTPIDIPAHTEFDPMLRPFEFVGYETLGQGDMEIINVGWSGTLNTELNIKYLFKKYFKLTGTLSGVTTLFGLSSKWGTFLKEFAP